MPLGYNIIYYMHNVLKCKIILHVQCAQMHVVHVLSICAQILIDLL